VEDKIAERANRFEEAVTLWHPRRADGHIVIMSSSRLACRLAAALAYVAMGRSAYRRRKGGR
jgi:hypothetical protein